MPMRPEDIEALLAQMTQGGGGAENPLARAIGMHAPPPVPPMGAGAMPQSAPPMPPAMAPPPAAMQAPAPMPDDEAMLDQIQQGMGAPEGDMQADADALVAMYEEGDPSDPAVLEQWRVAKEEFIAKYGEENLPNLPNDPDAAEEYGGAEGSDQYAAEDSESRNQQSSGEFESFRKRNRRTSS